MRQAVLDLDSSLPVWRIPAWSARTIRRAFGPGWRVIRLRRAESRGLRGAVRRRVLAAARGAEVYIGWGIPEAVVVAARGSLRWVHTAAAGVGGSLHPALLATRARVTNSRGIHAEPMADWVVAAIGFCRRGFHWAAAGQRAHRWVREELSSGSVPVGELAGTRVGLVGVGGVGRAVARRCRALGMEVAAVRLHPERGRPPGVSWIGGPRELVRLARRSDVLVIAAPHTRATRGMVDAGVLRALPRGAFVLNVSRGALLDEAALLEQLDRGQLGGCVLDVFESEPLPRGHPFWAHPRVFVTPHVSAISSRYWERETELIVENIGRYLEGRRLKNLVDPKAGY